MQTKQCLLKHESQCKKNFQDKNCFYNCTKSGTIIDQDNNTFHIEKRSWNNTEIYNDPILYIPEALKEFDFNYLLDYRDFSFFRLSDSKKCKIYESFKNQIIFPSLIKNRTYGNYNRGLS